MKYKIHQVRLDKLERAIVNFKGHEALDKQVRKRNMDFAENHEMEKLVNESWNAGDYDYVADITADTLNQVFHIGNMDIPREENMHINDKAGMYSVSIGDIIETDEAKHVVASYGFIKI
tara:strand:- start:101 stop:457 length:357 start_codon:yes stop_codon:yes gene_type:complete